MHPKGVSVEGRRVRRLWKLGGVRPGVGGDYVPAEKGANTTEALEVKQRRVCAWLGAGFTVFT